MRAKTIGQKSNFMVLSASFFFTILYLVSYILAVIYSKDSLTPVEDPYRDNIYPTMCCISHVGTAVILLWNAFTIGACNLTKWAAILYASLTTMSLLYSILLFEYSIILTITLFASVIGVTGLLIAYILKRWIL